MSENGEMPLTKGLDGFVQDILLLSGCTSRVGELATELSDGRLEIRILAV